MQLTTGLKVLALGAVLVMTSACRDDDSDLSSSFDLDSAQNSSPTISGTPRTKARAGERYQFTPRATDPEQETLRFSVANKPTWLAFDRRERAALRNARCQRPGPLLRRHDLRHRWQSRRRRWRRSPSSSKRASATRRATAGRSRRTCRPPAGRSDSPRYRRSSSCVVTARPSISESSTWTPATAGRLATSTTAATGSRGSRRGSRSSTETWTA